MNLSDFSSLIEDTLTRVERLEGFEGTEFIYPLTYGLAGVKTPQRARLEAAYTHVRRESGGYFLEALWLAEIVASLKEDRTRFFVTDDAFRRMCVDLNQGINGWALIMGRSDPATLVSLSKKLVSKRFRVFVAGKTSQRELSEQVTDLGSSDLSLVYFAQLLVRYALIYGRAQAGDPHELSHIIEDHAPGVIFMVGEPSGVERLLIQGLLSLGVPAIALRQNYGLVGAIKISQMVDEMVEDAWRLPNIRARVVEAETPAIPVPYGLVFAREEVKDDAVGLRLGGTDHSFFAVQPSSQVEDDEILVPPGWERATALGITVELGNSEVDAPMTRWIETVVRRVINCARGVTFSARGSTKATLLLSKEAIHRGLTLEHVGRVIMTGLRNEFPSIGPIRVTFTLNDEVEQEYPRIQAFLHARALEIKQATDENEPFFYGCTRCRSFSLAHACTVTPERPPQCGGKPWYRVKAQAFLAPDSVYNPSQIVEKGRCLDELRGEYEGVNKSTAKRTDGRVTRVRLHSIFDFPHTACSCFQNIAFYMSEVDGIGLMHRGYTGSAPNGATWTHLANQIAGRQYRGGAASFSVEYMKSRKFLQGDGGWSRIVWIAKNLKKVADAAIPAEIRERIATEDDAATITELKQFLTDTGRIHS